jgi:GTP-binding protein
MSAPSRPRIVVVGRPNVGKSTLFNRLVGYKRALVHDEPGVTRDRLELETTWWVKAKEFPVLVTDTGGLGGERFVDEIKKQVDIALAEADAVLMVFDGQAGLTPADEELIRGFIQSGLAKRVPFIGVVNKVDAEVHESMINDFYAAGLERLLTVSAEHDRGIDDLEVSIAEALGFDFEKAATVSESGSASEEEETAGIEGESDGDADDEAEELEGELEEGLEGELEDEPEPTERKVPRIAILGRPNVGKSTLVNALLGEERMITSPIAGTTVDSIDSVVELGGRPFVVVDTAGIRRKSKTEQGVEVLSVVQSRKALESADIAILVLDGEGGITDQDEKIGGLIEESGKSVILAVNKWDTQRRNPEFTRDIAADVLRKEMGFLKYAPIVFMSAKFGRGIDGLADLVDEILSQRRLKLATRELTEWVRRESTIHNPMNAKFFLAHQSGRHPPTFVVHVNDPERVHFSLQRHLVNALRERWGFMGSPVRMLFIEGKNRRSLPKPRANKKPKPARPHAN